MSREKNLRWAVAAIGVLWSASRAHVHGWHHICRTSALQHATVLPFRSAWVCLPCRPPRLGRGRRDELGGRSERPCEVMTRGVMRFARGADRPLVLPIAALHSGRHAATSTAQEIASEAQSASQKSFGLVNKQVYQDALQCLRLAWHRRNRLLPDEEFSVRCNRYGADVSAEHHVIRNGFDIANRCKRAPTNVLVPDVPPSHHPHLSQGL